MGSVFLKVLVDKNIKTAYKAIPIGNSTRTIGKGAMKQKTNQQSKPNSQQPDRLRIQINVLLEGEDATRFQQFQAANKLRQKGAAGYRLIVERLEQLQPAA